MIERRFILRSENIRAGMLAFLARLDISKTLEVVVREYVEKRTLEQNARLWLLHSRAAEFVGCSAADMHEDMLCEFFGYTEVRMPSGDLKRIPLKRSSTRNKKEFRDFMDKVEMFYIEKLGVYLDCEREAA